MKKIIRMLPIICLLLHAGLIHSSQYPIELGELHGASKSFCIANGITSVDLNIKEMHGSTVSLKIPDSVTKINLNIREMKGSSLYLYMRHTPLIIRNIRESHGSCVSELHPIREFTVPIIAFTTLAVGAWWFCSKND